MSWEQKLLETYENNIDVVPDGSFERLAPLFHSYVEANLEITISQNGDFLSANRLNEENNKTLMPDPFKPTLRYLSDRIQEFGGSTGEGFLALYEKSLKGLLSYSVEEHTKDIISAILKYLEKETILDDLTSSGILSKEDISFSSEVIVRFIVVLNDKIIKLWEDTTLIKDCIAYCSSLMSGKEVVSILSGEKEKEIEARDFPSHIYPKGLNRRLVSADQSKGQIKYTGRFADKSKEVVPLGFESSQKIARALKWLVKNQGFYIKSRRKDDGDYTYYVYWSPEPRVKSSAFGNFILKRSSVDDSVYNELKNLLDGTNIDAKSHPSMIMLVLSSPSGVRGTLAISEYYELDFQIFKERIKNWYEGCSWILYRNGSLVKDSLTLWEIIKATVGLLSDNYIEVDENEQVRYLGMFQKYLLSGEKLPRWVVTALLRRTSYLLKWKNQANFMLSASCAIIRKYNIDYNRGVTSMVLDVSCTNRSYLFGRLLAIGENIESLVNYKRGISRETSAMKLQGSFVQKPWYTWKIIEDKLIPYWGKLSDRNRFYYRNLVTEIISLFSEEDFSKKTALDENYLLGYYLQRAEFFKKKESSNKEETNSEE